MKTFTYWIAPCLDDHPCYSVIGKTKREVSEQLRHREDKDSFGPIEKRQILYNNLFHFFEYVTNEGGGRAAGYTSEAMKRYFPELMK